MEAFSRAAVSKFLLPLAFLVSLLVLLVVIVDIGRDLSSQEAFLFTLADDAMISMSYAKTFASGGGLVWFPGADKVQGITNPSWVLVMAMIHYLGFEGESAVIVLQAIGAILLAVTGLIVGQIFIQGSANLAENGNASGLREGFVIVAVFSSTTVFPLVFWTLRGFETGAIALASVLLFRLGLKVQEDSTVGFARAAGFVGVAMLGLSVRLDFAVFIFGLGVVLLIRSRRQEKKLKVMAIGGLAIVLFAGIILFLQFLYFGSWVPNTYFLKVGESDLAERLARGLSSILKASPVLAGFVISAGWLIFRGSAHHASRDLAILSIGAVLPVFAYSIVQGGDSWEEFGVINRFIAPVLPIVLLTIVAAAYSFFLLSHTRLQIVAYLAILAVIAVIGTGLHETLRGWAALTVGFAAAALLSVWFSYRSRQLPVLLFSVVSISGLLGTVVGGPSLIAWLDGERFDVAASQQMVRKSLLARDATLPTAKVAVTWAGIPAYYMGREMIDLLGKNDSYVASLAPNNESELGFWPGHTKWNVEYSIGDLQPDVILNNWHFSEREEGLIRDLGYEIRCLSSGQQIWVLQNTGAVRPEKISTCRTDN